MDWRAQVEQLGPAEGRQASALDRIDAVLAGEPIADHLMVVRRDVCDDGHLHADVSLWLLTATRLVSIEVNDAHHLHAPTPYDGTSVAALQVPLRAIDDVALNSWIAEDGGPAALLSVAHRSGRGGGTVTAHSCDDPDCPDDGTYLVESWDEGLEIAAAAEEVPGVLRFTGALGRAVAGL